MKKIWLLSWILCVLLTACNSAGIPVTPTSTLIPVPSSTATPTEPPTEIPTVAPTATKELSPQEQLERDFGFLVSKDEKCINNPVNNPDDGSISVYDTTQANTRYVVFQVHATNPANATWETRQLGPPQDKKPREVLTLKVVCRDANGDIIEPFKLILGGKDFGKDGADINEYYLTSPVKIDPVTGAGSNTQIYETGPVQEILNYIKEGDLIRITVAIKPGTGDIKNVSWPDGVTNQLRIIALNTVRYDTDYSQAVILLAQGEREIYSG